MTNRNNSNLRMMKALPIVASRSKGLFGLFSFLDSQFQGLLDFTSRPPLKADRE